MARDKRGGSEQPKGHAPAHQPRQDAPELPDAVPAHREAKASPGPTSAEHRAVPHPAQFVALEPAVPEVGQPPDGSFLAQVWPHGGLDWDSEHYAAGEVIVVDPTKHKQSDFEALVAFGVLTLP